jgi:hypothetical protein
MADLESDRGIVWITQLQDLGGFMIEGPYSGFRSASFIAPPRLRAVLTLEAKFLWL